MYVRAYRILRSQRYIKSVAAGTSSVLGLKYLHHRGVYNFIAALYKMWGSAA